MEAGLTSQTISFSPSFLLNREPRFLKVFMVIADNQSKQSARVSSLVPQEKPRTRATTMQAETQLTRTERTGREERARARSDFSFAGRAQGRHRFFQRAAALAKANEALRAQIAERNRVEQALRESEEKFRAIVETTREWIWATDRRGLHTYSNPAVKTILGYTRKKFWDRNA